MKRDDFRSFGLEAKLIRPSAYPNELMTTVRTLFGTVFVERTSYRATGCILTNLITATPTQPTLFEDPVKIIKTRKLYDAVDNIREQYGKHAVYHAVTLPAQHTQHLTTRGDIPKRKQTLLKGENPQQRLPLPLLQVEAK